MSERLPADYGSDNRCTGCGEHLSSYHARDCPFADISDEEAQATYERWSGYSSDAATWSADGSHQDQRREARLPLRWEPETEEGGPEDPKVWIGALAAYNAGFLHGSWVQMNRDLDGVYRDRDEILRSSPEPAEEEWYIGDHENYEPLRIGEYESLEVLHAIAEGIDEHGEPFTYYLDLFGGWDTDTPDEIRERAHKFDDYYCGHYDSLEDFVYQEIEDVGIESAVNAFKEDHDFYGQYVKFDYDAYMRDLDANGLYFTVDAPDGGVFVFRQDA